MTDATLGASGLGLETRTGVVGTATLSLSFFGRSPWLHERKEKEEEKKKKEKERKKKGPIKLEKIEFRSPS